MLDKELKKYKREATEASTNTKKAISAWIIANPLANFKSIRRARTKFNRMDS